MIKNRNIVMCILLSFVTCGLYGIYWVIAINNEMCALTPNDDYQTSGGLVVVLMLVTCGIYALYWYYKMGTKVDIIKQDGGNGNAVLFLLLGLFGLGIVPCCIMQNEINLRAN